MHQSYKTIRRAPFLISGGCGLLFLFLGIFSLAAQVPVPPGKTKPDRRHAEVFPHYELRFMVPVSQADAVWEYLLQNYFQPDDTNAEIKPEMEEEQLTDLYFDTPKKDLLRQNLAFRQRLFISADGRKQHLQLILPAQPDSAFGYEARFRHNKRPDKGAAFTSHPLLKLLRKKDRPLLDSLLKPYQLNAQDLETVMEINQDRKNLQVRHNGNEWLMLTLTALLVQSPEHKRIELQIMADPRALLQANPTTRRQILKAADDLAKQLQNEFPELKRTQKQEYAIMETLQKTPAVQKVSTKAIFGISFLVLIVAAMLYLKFRKKPKQAFD